MLATSLGFRAGGPVQFNRPAHCERKMKNLFVRFVCEENGQDLIEYSLLAALISVGSIAVMNPLSVAINGVFTSGHDRARHRFVVGYPARLGAVLPSRRVGLALKSSPIQRDRASSGTSTNSASSSAVSRSRGSRREPRARSVAAGRFSRSRPVDGRRISSCGRLVTRRWLVTCQVTRVYLRLISQQLTATHRRYQTCDISLP